jgi:hypothetical protein
VYTLQPVTTTTSAFNNEISFPLHDSKRHQFELSGETRHFLYRNRNERDIEICITEADIAKLCFCWERD